MPSSIKGKGAWVSGARPLGDILDDIISPEKTSIERYRKIDDAILHDLYRRYPVRYFSEDSFIPTYTSHVSLVITTNIPRSKLQKISPEEFYRSRVKQLRAWGWFSRGPEDLTKEE